MPDQKSQIEPLDTNISFREVPPNEPLEESVEKYMCLPLFIAANMFRSPIDEVRQSLVSCGLHREVVDRLPS